MAQGLNHYEQAVEQFLHRQGTAFAPMDEERRPDLNGHVLKNFDFLVFRPSFEHLLLEVKGRRLTRSSTPNAWATRKDLASLLGWRRRFGDRYKAALCFVFDITRAKGLQSHFEHGDVSYQGWLVDALDFQRLAHVRSRRWETLSLRVSAFRRVARPLFNEISGSTASNQSEIRFTGSTLLSASAIEE